MTPCPDLSFHFRAPLFQKWYIHYSPVRLLTFTPLLRSPYPLSPTHISNKKWKEKTLKKLNSLVILSREHCKTKCSDQQPTISLMGHLSCPKPCSTSYAKSVPQLRHPKTLRAAWSTLGKHHHSYVEMKSNSNHDAVFCTSLFGTCTAMYGMEILSAILKLEHNQPCWHEYWEFPPLTTTNDNTAVTVDEEWKWV